MGLKGNRFGNPAGMVARTTTVTQLAATPLGLRPKGKVTQGSAAGATLGFETESRWDSGGNFPGWNLIDLFEADPCKGLRGRGHSKALDNTPGRRFPREWEWGGGAGAVECRRDGGVLGRVRASGFTAFQGDGLAGGDGGANEGAGNFHGRPGFRKPFGQQGGEIRRDEVVQGQ